MQHFESKKDISICLLLLVGIAGCVAGVIIDYLDPATETNILLYVVLGFIAILLFWIFFSTYYQLTKDGLRVVSGPYRKTVSYKDITGVKETRTLLSSPALSFDRLEVMTKAMVPLVISPLEKEKFIKKLEEKIAMVEKSSQS